MPCSDLQPVCWTVTIMIINVVRNRRVIAIFMFVSDAASDAVGDDATETAKRSSCTRDVACRHGTARHGTARLLLLLSQLTECLVLLRSAVPTYIRTENRLCASWQSRGYEIWRCLFIPSSSTLYSSHPFFFPPVSPFFFPYIPLPPPHTNSIEVWKRSQWGRWPQQNLKVPHFKYYWSLTTIWNRLLCDPMIK